MGNVRVTLKNGKTVVLPDTTMSAVTSALGSGEAQAGFVLENGENVAFSNEEVSSIVAEEAGALPDDEAGPSEVPGSGTNPPGPHT